MTLHAITVLGHDRPGIIADTTGGLAGLGLNLEDSSMTLLRGHFAMTLICEGDVAESDIEQALAPVSQDGSLIVTVRELPVEEPGGAPGTAWVLTVHGGDRPGILSKVAGEVARFGGNITDLTTRLVGELYFVVAEVDLPAGTDASVVESELRALAGDLGVGISLLPAETDEL